MSRSRSQQLTILLGSAGLGTVAAALYAARGRYGQAVFAFVLLLVVGGVLAFSKGEWAVAQGPAADERQRSLNDAAMRIAYRAVIVVAVIGFFYEIATKTFGAFTIICAVGGFTHSLALAVLRRRA